MMNADRFAEIVAAYGADPRRWPADERAAAEAFASADPEIAGPMLADAAKLDAVLDAAGDAPDAGALRRLTERVVARAAPPPRRIAVAAAAALLAGVSAGWLASAALGPATEPAAAYAVAFGALDADSGWLADEEDAL